MNNNLRINIIILAAGFGKRVGSIPKWKLRYNGKLLLEFIYSKLDIFKFNNICCVVNKDFFNDHDFTNSDFILNDRIEYVINNFPEFGMISSVHLGVNNNLTGDYYIIFPVDFPFVKIDTIKLLIDAISFNKNKTVIKPIFNNNSGHPIIISKNMAIKIPKFYNGGVKKFLDDNIKNEDIYLLNVDDNGIFININTIEDIKKYDIKLK